MSIAQGDAWIDNAKRTRRRTIWTPRAISLTMAAHVEKIVRSGSRKTVPDD
jgi:hypothetical protein